MRRSISVLLAFGLVAGFQITTFAKRTPPPSGARCIPYICNGRIYPTCTPQGYPINYFRNPCAPLPRR